VQDGSFTRPGGPGCRLPPADRGRIVKIGYCRYLSRAVSRCARSGRRGCTSGTRARARRPPVRSPEVTLSEKKVGLARGKSLYGFRPSGRAPVGSEALYLRPNSLVSEPRLCATVKGGLKILRKEPEPSLC